MRSASIVSHLASIINLLLPILLVSSLFFSYCLLHFLSACPVSGDVVDLYSDRAISLALTGNVGGLKGYIGIGTTIGELGTVGGVPIFGNAIGEVESPNVESAR